MEAVTLKSSTVPPIASLACNRDAQHAIHFLRAIMIRDSLHVYGYVAVYMSAVVYRMASNQDEPTSVSYYLCYREQHYQAGSRQLLNDVIEKFKCLSGWQLGAAHLVLSHLPAEG